MSSISASDDKNDGVVTLTYKTTSNDNVVYKESTVLDPANQNYRTKRSNVGMRDRQAFEDTTRTEVTSGTYSGRTANILHDTNFIHWDGQPPSSSSSPFRLPSVKELTLNEKLKLISGKSLWLLAEVRRFKIPSIRVSDGPHGVRKPVKELSMQQSFPATCFPTAAALACSWDPELVQLVGRALRKECLYYDVSCLLGPGMNLKRHPCGGRNFEYFSEDPFLCGKLAVAFIQGVQGSGEIAACAKHFAVNNQEGHRFVVNAVVDERTLRELYLRHFEMVVKEAKPMSLMCAYNKVNGQYCSEHDYLNVKILREEWGFDGLIMSDWGAVNDRVKGIKAQLDLEMPGSHGVHNREIRRALSDGYLTEAEIDTCAQRVLTFIQKVRLDVDRTTAQEVPDKPNRSAPRSISWPAQHDIAKKVALECAVLLKNTDNFLPLDATTVESVAVIGEFGKNFPRFQGMGSSHVHAERVRAAHAEVFRFCDNVSFSPGYEDDDENINGVNFELLERATNVAQMAQVVILCVGLPEIMESEGFDRPHIQMPAQHNALITEVCKVNQNVIVVLCNGGPVEMPWLDKPKAIFEAYLMGEAGGAAIVDLVFGTQSPCGKLPETFPIRMTDVLADGYFPGTQDLVEHREGLDVGYRFFDSANKPVLFPFGFGLTYTTFGYGQLKVEVVADEVKSKLVKVTFDVTNEGSFPAKEIIQCYVHDIEASVYRPYQELKAFEKIFLFPGEKKEVTLNLSFDAFAFYDVGVKDWIVEPGFFDLLIGSSSRDIRQRAMIEVKTGQKASQVGQTSYPPRPYGSEREMNDGTFHGRFVGQVLDGVRLWIPQDHRVIHRNSLLKNASTASTLGQILRWVVFKGATADLQPGPTYARDEKLHRIVVGSLPLRTIVLFGQGCLSFELLDALISIMNGNYRKAFLDFCVALTPFRRKARRCQQVTTAQAQINSEP